LDIYVSQKDNPFKKITEADRDEFRGDISFLVESLKPLS